MARLAYGLKADITDQIASGIIPNDCIIITSDQKSEAFYLNRYGQLNQISDYTTFTNMTDANEFASEPKNVGRIISILVNGQWNAYIVGVNGTLQAYRTAAQQDTIDNGYVSYTAQALTAEQQAQARDNISAADAEELNGIVWHEYPFHKSDFAVCYYANDLTRITSTTARIAFGHVLTVHKGDRLHITTGTLQIGVYYKYAHESISAVLHTIVDYTNQLSDYTYVFPYDGYFFIQCKATNGGTVTTDDYDATIVFQRASRNLTTRRSNILSINHRGYQFAAPENTLLAFKLSAEMGFTDVESDVQFTSDGVPVIVHDRAINRTARNANGTELTTTVNIDDITYEEALAYDFGIYRGAQFAGTKIPTFEQLVKLCKKLGLVLHIELKDETVTTTKIPDLFTIVDKYGMRKNVVWMSFNRSLLQYIATNYPAEPLSFVKTSATTEFVSQALQLKTGQNTVEIALYHEQTFAVMPEIIASGLPLNVFTIETIPAAESIRDYATVVTTDGYDVGEIQSWVGKRNL